uniref:HMA domain-containing protein n=1 Tax=Physcomitrium patens TaxID=3218 RepID=A0A7I4CS58_PHYPA
MWTINELFYGPEPALTYIYEYPKLKPVEDVVVKELNHAKEKKGHNGEVHLKVDMCCEACVKKVRRILIELDGAHSPLLRTHSWIENHFHCVLVSPQRLSILP